MSTKFSGGALWPLYAIRASQDAHSSPGLDLDHHLLSWSVGNALETLPRAVLLEWTNAAVVAHAGDPREARLLGASLTLFVTLGDSLFRSLCVAAVSTARFSDGMMARSSD